MCGRYTLTAPGEEVARRFGLGEVPDLAPRYNIAPTQPVPIVRRARGAPRRELVQVRWGLVPHWAEDPSIGNRLINARAETLRAKPAFRDAFAARRCLLPATGFFEWTKEGRARQPWLLRMKGGALFALAGLWARWRPEEGEALESCTIITGEPNAVAAPLHDRMPVILAPEDWDAWLDPATPPAVLEKLLEAAEAEGMEALRVKRAVNTAANDVPECLEPAEDAP